MVRGDTNKETAQEDLDHIAAAVALDLDPGHQDLLQDLVAEERSIERVIEEEVPVLLVDQRVLLVEEEVRAEATVEAVVKIVEDLLQGLNHLHQDLILKDHIVGIKGV